MNFKLKIELYCTKLMYLGVIFYKKFISPCRYFLRVCFGITCECRFTPTCSDYALQCLQKYSPLRAFYLISKRLLRCHPLCHGGYDPIP